jgi:hypothetical protein
MKYGSIAYWISGSSYQKVVFSGYVSGAARAWAAAQPLRTAPSSVAG